MLYNLNFAANPCYNKSSNSTLTDDSKSHKAAKGDILSLRWQLITVKKQDCSLKIVIAGLLFLLESKADFFLEENLKNMIQWGVQNYEAGLKCAYTVHLKD